MHKRFRLGWGAFAILVVLSSQIMAEQYVIDPVHSDVSFKVRHMMISKVVGKFDKFSGEISYDEKDPKSWAAQASIEAVSINTSNEKRDAHLRSEEFFDAKKFPLITFKSAKVTDVKEGKANLHGFLSLHGVEKPVILNLEIGGVIQDPMGTTRAGFEATTKINRKDFGVVYNKLLEGGGLAIGEEVEISIHVEGVVPQKKSEEKPSEPAQPKSK